jgi:hypothetical protein
MSSTGEGMKPLKRGRAGSNALCARSATGTIDPGGIAFGLSDELVLVANQFRGGAIGSRLKSLLNAASVTPIARGDARSRDDGDPR